MNGRDDDLAKFAAILDDFAAAQRAQALDQAKKQRITIVRNIGQVCQCTFETVIEEGATAEEIFALLAPIDAALDRLKAKADLSDHLNLTLNAVAQIEMHAKKMAASRIEWQVENERAAQNRRRQLVGLTQNQERQLAEQRTTMRSLFAQVDEKRKAAAEARRILGGEDPFALLEEQVAARIEAIRGARLADQEAA